jgi:hypothetical protein
LPEENTTQYAQRIRSLIKEIESEERRLLDRSPQGILTDDKMRLNWFINGLVNDQIATVCASKAKSLEEGITVARQEETRLANKIALSKSNQRQINHVGFEDERLSAIVETLNKLERKLEKLSEEATRNTTEGQGTTRSPPPRRHQDWRYENRGYQNRGYNNGWREGNTSRYRDLGRYSERNPSRTREYRNRSRERSLPRRDNREDYRPRSSSRSGRRDHNDGRSPTYRSAYYDDRRYSPRESSRTRDESSRDGTYRQQNYGRRQEADLTRQEANYDDRRYRPRESSGSRDEPSREETHRQQNYGRRQDIDLTRQDLDRLTLN